MNAILRILTVLTGSFVLLPSAFGAPSVADEGGLIGKFHVGADYAFHHYTSSSLDKAHGARAVLNSPYSENVDLALEYDYAHSSGSLAGATKNALSGTILTFNRTEHGKAYFAASLGHAWDRVLVGGARLSESGAFWGVRTGYEIPVGYRTAVNAGVGFMDSFGRGVYRTRTLRYRLEASRWFTEVLAGVVSASYEQIKDAPDAVIYTVGLKWTL